MVGSLKCLPTESNTLNPSLAFSWKWMFRKTKEKKIKENKWERRRRTLNRTLFLQGLTRLWTVFMSFKHIWKHKSLSSLEKSRKVLKNSKPYVSATWKAGNSYPLFKNAKRGTAAWNYVFLYFLRVRINRTEIFECNGSFWVNFNWSYLFFSSSSSPPPP